MLLQRQHDKMINVAERCAHRALKRFASSSVLTWLLARSRGANSGKPFPGVFHKPRPMFHHIRTYAELRRQIHDDLRLQHPDWVQPNGESPICDSYEARLMELIARLRGTDLEHAQRSRIG